MIHKRRDTASVGNFSGFPPSTLLDKDVKNALFQMRKQVQRRRVGVGPGMGGGGVERSWLPSQ